MTGKTPQKQAGKEDELVVIETKPGSTKEIGGGESDKWNFRQMQLMLSALPGVTNFDKKNTGEVGSAVVSGLMDLKPRDPIEGMLMSQIVVAHEAALDMYRRAWSQPPEYFEARCGYLRMADKAQRTLAMLTERLDRHRGAGQQSITVKHITVNADNAIVGNVENRPKDRTLAELKGRLHATSHAFQPEMWRENSERGRVPLAGDAERTLPAPRRTVSRRSERE
jgi:hypothetical protein